MQQFLNALEADRGFSANTIAAYRNDLEQFCTYVQNPPQTDHVPAIAAWGELTEAHLSTYILHLRAGIRGLDDRPQDRRAQVVQRLPGRARQSPGAMPPRS